MEVFLTWLIEKIKLLKITLVILLLMNDLAAQTPVEYEGGMQYIYDKENVCVEKILFNRNGENVFFNVKENNKFANLKLPTIRLNIYGYPLYEYSVNSNLPLAFQNLNFFQDSIKFLTSSSFVFKNIGLYTLCAYNLSLLDGDLETLDYESEILFFDFNGNVISTLSDIRKRIGWAIVTENGKYFASIFKEFEGNSLKKSIRKGIHIYDIIEKKLLYQIYLNDNEKFSLPAKVQNNPNLIRIEKTIYTPGPGEKRKREMIIIDLSEKLIYSNTYTIFKRRRLKDVKPDRLIFYGDENTEVEELYKEHFQIKKIIE